MRHLCVLGVLACVVLLPSFERRNAYVPPPAPRVMVGHPLRQALPPYLEATGKTAACNQLDLVARGVEGRLTCCGTAASATGVSLPLRY